MDIRVQNVRRAGSSLSVTLEQPLRSPEGRRAIRILSMYPISGINYSTRIVNLGVSGPDFDAIDSTVKCQTVFDRYASVQMSVVDTEVRVFAFGGTMHRNLLSPKEVAALRGAGHTVALELRVRATLPWTTGDNERLADLLPPSQLSIYSQADPSVRALGVRLQGNLALVDPWELAKQISKQIDVVMAHAA